MEWKIPTMVITDYGHKNSSLIQSYSFLLLFREVASIHQNQGMANPDDEIRSYSLAKCVCMYVVRLKMNHI